MGSFLKKAKNLIKTTKSNFFNDYSTLSYSQEGEDLILHRVFEETKIGFYVDIGAFHPKRFSNTYFFYQRGWSGINIDATPGSMNLFKRVRPRDINLEVAIGNDRKEIEFFIFNEPALNSFDYELSHSRRSDQYYIQEVRKLTTKPLKKVLCEYLTQNSRISFMSIDVEGFDLEVLQSNDWGFFRPEYLLVECREFNFEKIQENPTFNFLIGKNYYFFAKTMNTLFFKDALSNTSDAV